MVVIAISGVVNSGKDCATLYLEKKTSGHYFKHLKLADPIQALTYKLIEPSSRLVDKEDLRDQFLDREWKETKAYLINNVLYSPRDIQIKLGKCLKEEFGMELFADILYQQIKKTSELTDEVNFVISDVRFPIEVDVLNRLPNVYFVYIDNKKAQETFLNDPKHRDADGNFLPSEAYHPFLRQIADIIISNNGTIDEFYAELDTLYNQLVLKVDAVEVQHTPDIVDFLKSCNA